MSSNAHYCSSQHSMSPFHCCLLLNVQDCGRVLVVFVTEAAHHFCLRSDLPFKMSYSLSLQLALIHRKLLLSVTPIFYSDYVVILLLFCHPFLVSGLLSFFNLLHFLTCLVTATTN